MHFINITDVRVPSDPAGRTWREINNATPHAIPLHTLVEVDYTGCEEHGCRLFVVEHARDCDGSTLYTLSSRREVLLERPTRAPSTEKEYIDRMVYLEQSGRLVRGCSDSMLIVIKEPRACTST